MRLKANDKVVATAELNEGNGWEYTFTDLNKNENGEEITYDADEATVPDGYTKIIEGDAATGFTITNEYEFETVDLEGTKTWEDGDNADGVRPGRITVHLLANGEEAASKTVTADDNWKYSFTGLPKNKNGAEITYTVTEDPIEGYTADVNGLDITNTHTYETVTISGTKVWADSNNADGLRPDSVTVALLAGGKKVKEQEVSGPGWNFSFEGLPKKKAGTEIVYTVSEKAVPGYTTAFSGNMTDGFTITNTHNPDQIYILVLKEWDDDNNRDGKRPDSVTVRLTANGQATGQTAELTEANYWYAFFSANRSQAGEEISYDIEEVTVDGYTVEKADPEEYKDNSGKVLYILHTLTNTHTPETTDVSANKTWDDDNDRDGIRPASVTVRLRANAATPTDLGDASVVELKEADNWEHTFTGLKKNENGEAITYTVEELTVPDGYEKTEEGLTVTNKHKIETVDLEGQKTWVDGNNADGVRPASVTVRLLADGVPVEGKVVTVTAEGGWKYSFTGLPKRAGGKAITYTVQEDAAEGYTTTYDGLNITNRHEYEKVTITGKKAWDDDNDADGLRPKKIKVALLANGEKVKEQVVYGSAGWTFSFADVPKKKAGEVITYTVTEEAVPGYSTAITGNMADGFTITNRHDPDQIYILVQKVWKDKSNQDGLRPDSITVALTTDGQETRTATLNEANYWYAFFSVNRSQAGAAIDYNVTEEAVDGYTVAKTQTVYREGGGDTGKILYVLYTITNTHTPEKTIVRGKKTWDDGNNRDGIRPASITVILNGANGEVARKAVTAADGWAYSFTVDKFYNGKEVNYYVSEEPVEGYVPTYSVKDITNTHVPGTISVYGQKLWDDKDDRDGIRPKSITVKLHRKIGNDDVVTDTKTVTEADNWAYSFANLYRYKDGQEITYYATEDPIPAQYTMNVSGTNLTNTYVPKTLHIYGTKIWDDANNQDGRRPEKIRVNLLADGKISDSQVVTLDSSGEWSFDFGYQHRKYMRGREIVYTVTEDPVIRYTTEIPEGVFDAAGENLAFTVTNAHTPDTTTVTGEKTWDDDDNRDGIRPASIRVTLSGKVVRPNGETIDLPGVASTQVVTPDAEGRWRYAFENVPVFAFGLKIEYTVTEDPVPGYTATYSEDGLDICNKHYPEMIMIQGTKRWESDDDLSDLRPSAVIVNLLANGVQVRSKRAEASLLWTYRFYDLPKYENGKEIVYTVEEEPVRYYDSSADSYDLVNTPRPVKYTVEWYYEAEGKYPDVPNLTEERLGITGRTAEVTEADKIPGRPRCYLDEEAPNIFSGTVLGNGSLILRIYFRTEYLITFDPNGGTLAGSKDPVSTQHRWGDVITIREEPTRAGYEFLYWEGSEYYPGDQYTVTEDHVFTARWRAEPEPEPEPEPVPPGPTYDYKFTFTKKWSGAHESSITWTLYDPEGKAVSKKFNKKTVSDTEWCYEAWFPTEKDYYIIEEVPKGYKVRYENTGVHANVTDRCYNGGTIINYKVPKTADASVPPVLWLVLAILGLGGIAFAAIRIRKRKQL